MSTPGSTPPEVSCTMPDTWAESNCADAVAAQESTRHEATSVRQFIRASNRGPFLTIGVGGVKVNDGLWTLPLALGGGALFEMQQPAFSPQAAAVTAQFATLVHHAVT